MIEEDLEVEGVAEEDLEDEELNMFLALILKILKILLNNNRLKITQIMQTPLPTVLTLMPF